MNDDIAVFTQKRMIRKRIRALFTLGMVAVILILGGYFAATRFFVVRNVEIQETDLYTPEDLAHTVALKEGISLFSVSKREICRSIEEKYSYLVDVTVKFKLPNTVQITFSEDFGDLVLKMGDEYYTLDRQLRVLAKEKELLSIPRIQLITQDVSTCFVGRKLTFFDSSTEKMLGDLLLALEKSEMIDRVVSVDIKDKFDLKLWYENRFEITLGDGNDLKHKMLMIREVVADLAENATGSIDVSDPNNAYVKLGEPIL